jgi:hypothetical protein
MVSPAAVETTSAVMIYCLNGGLSIALVVIGGLFAGLTLAQVFFYYLFSYR